MGSSTRFGLLHVALGALLLSGGPLSGSLGAPWLWALAWPGASCFVVGLGYLGIGPRVFGKAAATGLIPWFVRLPMLPYYGVAWSLWQLKARTQGEAPFHEVAPGIFVGRRPIAAGEAPEGLAEVVDLTSEFSRYGDFCKAARYRCVPTLDTAAPALAELRRLTDELSGAPGPVLFHCAMGHGRSATAAAALMIRRGLARDVDEAVMMMQAVRPRVFLHGDQRRVAAEVTAERVDSSSAGLGEGTATP